MDADRRNEVAAAVVSAWSLVHGFTLLAIDRLTLLETELETDRLVDLTSPRFMKGLASKDA